MRITARQKELLQLMIEGFTLHEAAKLMCISPKTATNSLIPVRKSLNVPTTQQAIMLLLRAGKLKL
ncbi:helix-turn-helix transcriptional regulator [Paenibacillus sp. MAH-36]|uniref:LuxR C-terminal-related transcriptional regulator n=1 Tax=Paenibacillus violae TaxID=3077234 RepID=A0ABU3R796_9BACL|nr:LuxR C-terminal-related transcriptional regulator [Paenibacillus sp. PFR10]MDU0200138.1 LuxR C-terminal-related transcriptional regulator [Paenibacillus sp. PFR10]